MAYIIYMVRRRDYGKSLVIFFFFFQTFITIINNTKVLKYISSVNIYRMQDAKLVL